MAEIAPILCVVQVRERPVWKPTQGNSPGDALPAGEAHHFLSTFFLEKIAGTGTSTGCDGCDPAPS